MGTRFEETDPPATAGGSDKSKAAGRVPAPLRGNSYRLHNKIRLPLAQRDSNLVSMLNMVNSGDNAWMLVSSALVLMMTGPGLALFYGGLVRKKNVLSTMMQSFALMAVVTVLWAL